MSVHNTVQRHPLQPASGSMSSPHLNGIDGRSNVTDFHNRVVYPLGLTEGVEFSWQHMVRKDANGNDFWTTTLTVLSPNGVAVDYTGYGARKGYSKDAAAYEYLVIHGFILRNPLGS